MAELTKRIFTAVIGIILLLYIVNTGGILLSSSILIVSILGILEVFHALERLNYKPLYPLGILSAILIYTSTMTHIINLDFIISLIVISSLVIFLFNEKYNIQDLAVTILTILYIPFCLFHVYYLDGSIYIWLVFIIAFGTDTFAYIIGSLFGKHKLYKKVSPNKSIEGALGGIIGSILIVIIFAFNYDLSPISHLVIMTIIASILSQIGDLVASKIKRLANLKDYGKLMLGHGGIMDRFDSIIFAAPIVYYFIELFIV